MSAMKRYAARLAESGPYPCRVRGCGTLMLQRPGACSSHPVGPVTVDPTGLVSVSAP